MKKFLFYIFEVLTLYPQFIAAAQIFSGHRMSPSLLPLSILGALLLILWSFCYLKGEPKLARFALASILLGFALWLPLPIVDAV